MPHPALRDILTLLGAVAGLSVGNVLLKIGMGRLDAAPAGALWSTITQTWQLPLGVVLMIVQFVGMLSLFKWGWPAGLVVPLLGLNYVLTALLEQAWLGTRLDRSAWIGIALVLVGVAFLARSTNPSTG
jgi:uncharacterized membrane protein